MFTLVVNAIEASAERLHANLDADTTIDLFPRLPGPHNRCVAAARCLEHYGRLIEVRCALDVTWNELHAVAVEGETLSRVLVRRRLDRLALALHEFGQSAIRLYSIPAFRRGVTVPDGAGDPWLLGLRDKSYEYLVPAVVNLYPLACPAIEVREPGASARLAYPIVPPSLRARGDLQVDELFPTLAPYRGYPYEVVVARDAEEETRRQVRARLRAERLELEDRQALAAAIAHTPAQRDRLDTVGGALSKAIERRFGLSGFRGDA